MRFGPLRPVGLVDPRTGHRPWANVQLRAENKHFQPMGANMGILPPLPEESRPRDKRLRYMAAAQRAVASFQQRLDENAL